ncbi:FUSC family protein [Streptomyces sp. 5-8]|uniref:FUSC family protein n=1 Tax=Streptomyces musisoli TaxID=2802280 RepID=A0ABS1PCC3_9ACTN|nr:FUSC family protein [Streptomyces musisoli]
MRGVPGARLPTAYAASGRRALRVTLVAGGCFYFFRYGLDNPVAAIYALFTVVALGGLSRIPGTGRQQAAVILRLLPVCWVLVTVGTYLSVRTWSAALGMLVVGFTLAFSAVGGPRPAGAAPGLQLLYMLPSFPPYDPGSLGDRLIGTTTGAVLFVVAEALLFREPAPLSYRERAARAALAAEHWAAGLAVSSCALTDADVQEARAAVQALRPLNVPDAERPAGPGVRDRALAHTGLAIRTLLSRLVQLPAAPGREATPATPAEPGREAAPAVPAAPRREATSGRPAPDVPAGPGQQAEPGVTAVLHAVASLAAATAACLRTGAPPVAEQRALTGARARLSDMSAGPPPTALTSLPPQEEADAPAAPLPPAVLRRHAAVLEIADAALAMGAAADLAVRGRHATVELPVGHFWYARNRAPVLWWHRMHGHAGRRSVFFQNAVRMALALAAARLVAGVDTLPHGFWATLATLTLTRTTLGATWSTIRVALAGTLAGALVSGGILIFVGSGTAVYAVLLPLLMLFSFTVGPVKGMGWAQGLFTVTVALVFAQLAQPTWRLAEVRILDVLVGSAIGAVFGVLAWPRGAHDEMRRAGAELLRRAAEIVVATSASVAGGAASPAPSGVPGRRSLQRAVILAESAYAQLQSEPPPLGGRGRRAGPPPVVDWQATLITGHHALWGSARMLEPPVTELGPAAAESAGTLGERVAGRMLLVSAALDPGEDTPVTSIPLIDPARAAFSVEPPGAPRQYYAAVAWLGSLMTDLTRIAHGDRAPGAGAAGADGR